MLVHSKLPQRHETAFQSGCHAPLLALPQQDMGLDPAASLTAPVTLWIEVSWCGSLEDTFALLATSWLLAFVVLDL